METMSQAMSPAMRTLMSSCGIARAWPEHGGELVVEHRGDDGHLRAGRIDAAGDLRLLPSGRDPRLPALTPFLSGNLVGHRAGKRALIDNGDVVTKLVRPGRQRRLAALQDSDLFSSAGIRTARVVSLAPGRIDTEALPGRALADMGDEGMEGWRALSVLWPQTMRATAQRGHSASPLPGLPVHSGEDEAAVLEMWLGCVRALGVDVPGMSDAVAEARAHLVEGAGRMGPCVRDQHDGQLRWDGKEISLSDLDAACWAESALDLGSMAARVELMGVGGRLSEGTRNEMLDLVGQVADELEVRPDRLAAYHRAAALRLILVHTVRPVSQSWLPEWTSLCLSRSDSDWRGSWA